MTRISYVPTDTDLARAWQGEHGAIAALRVHAPRPAAPRSYAPSMRLVAAMLAIGAATAIIATLTI